MAPKSFVRARASRRGILTSEGHFLTGASVLYRCKILVFEMMARLVCGAKHYFGRCPSLLWIDLFWLLACLELLFVVPVLDCCWFDHEGVAFMSQKFVNSFVH